VKLGEVAAAIGKGLVAGAAGTAAMTVSSALEMKARGRKPSSAPAEAATEALVSPDTPNGDAGDTEDAADLTFVHDQTVAGSGAGQGGAAARNGGSKLTPRADLN
jgi:hypothetical protein